VKLFGRKAAVVAITAVIGLGALGSAAFAAFAPVAADTFTLVPSLPGTAVAAPKGGGDKLKALLDALVTKGVITQSQEDAIIAAAQNARGDKDGDEFLRLVFAKLFEQSASYLAVQPADLKAKLPGTSLAALANAAGNGKSRDGLVSYLTNVANNAITTALADKKITQDQADKAKAAVPGHIASFVDHVYPKVQPRATVPSIKAFVGDAERAARDYLGLADKDLVTALRSGKSLGEIADTTTGKSRAGLIATLVAATNTKIDTAQQDGKLTADQATQIKNNVQTAITQLVDRKMTKPVKSR